MKPSRDVPWEQGVAPILLDHGTSMALSIGDSKLLGVHLHVKDIESSSRRSRDLLISSRLVSTTRRERRCAETCAEGSGSKSPSYSSEGC